jgi:hypothetical protein
LRREVPTIHAAGAELVVIGNGNLHFAKAFRDELELDTPLYIDTTRATYRALGMKRGIARTLGPRTWLRSLRALRQGFRQKRTRGDPWQLGGVLMVLRDGSIAYRYLSEVAGDHPSLDEVLAAVSGET